MNRILLFQKLPKHLFYTRLSFFETFKENYFNFLFFFYLALLFVLNILIICDKHRLLTVRGLKESLF